MTARGREGGITVRNVSKHYKRYPTRWGRAAEWMTAGYHQTHEARWVLRDVSFEVGPADAVGIVGQNGAGKSTLLKILTGTTHPSTGSFEVRGRVSALLELGMGFHPDFTGRQNAVTGCQTLGLSTAEIAERLPEIAAFAELWDFMEQPLRSYSSGMQMRLAFSVATAIRPEVLIVDEALAVGDAYFQHKGMKRIRAFRDQGTTLLFVSHDPGAVKSMCDRALLLDQGLLIRDGSPSSVLDYYNALIAKKERDAEILQLEHEHGRTTTRSGNGRARILSVEMTDVHEHPARAFQVGDTATLHCAVQFNAAIHAPTIGILIRDRLGNDVFGTNTHHLQIGPEQVAARDRWAATFATVLNLGVGHYSVAVAVHAGAAHLDDNFDWWDQALVFQVVPSNAPYFVGTASLPVQVRLERLPPAD